MTRASAFALLLALAPLPLAAQSWPEEDYNPHPAADDVILPMRCDGAVAFRRVETGPSGEDVEGLYGDASFWMGWAGARDTAYRESEWKSYVSGGLRDAAGRYYLIGKYELTEGQWRALMDEGRCLAEEPATSCPAETDTDDGLPMSGLSWHDAIEFTSCYTQWLYANAPEVLPDTMGGGAFVRPPTEPEWEFAARGGTQVPDAQRRNERYPMPEGLDAHAWRLGTDSADGGRNYVGLKAANPLQLYDVYGNVSEIMFEPFRVNRAGRMHGHAGGFIVKGGSFRSPAETLRSGARQEARFFSPEVDGALVRQSDVGLRLALSGPATGDLGHAQALSEKWADIPVFRADGESPIEALRRLADAAPDRNAQAALEEVANAVAAEIAMRQEIEAEAIRNMLLSGALIARRIDGIFFNVTEIRREFPEIDQAPRDGQSDVIALARRRYAAQLDDFNEFAAVYADTFLRLTTAYGQEEVVDLARTLIGELDGRGRERLATYLSKFAVQVRDHDPAGGWNDREALVSLLRRMRGIEEPPPWVDAALER